MKQIAKKQAAFISALREPICHRNIESLFLYHASPVLRGVKPAVLITVRKECVALWKSHKNEMCKATGLDFTELRNKESSSLFLIYEKCEIKKVLANKKSISILESFGYVSDSDIDELISRLSARLYENEFPHEIGLFLGYPPGDVKAYIKNEGKNFLCCRYWKVYENVSTAQKIWERIDEAQNYALDILREFPPIHIAACLLRTA